MWAYKTYGRPRGLTIINASDVAGIIAESRSRRARRRAERAAMERKLPSTIPTAARERHAVPASERGGHVAHGPAARLGPWHGKAAGGSPPYSSAG